MIEAALYQLAATRPQLLRQGGRVAQVEDRLRQHRRVLWLYIKRRASILLGELARLSVHREHDWPGAGHRLIHLYRQHALEKRNLARVDQAGVGCREQLRHARVRLRVKESYIR